jgi:hypothetical protein
VAFDDGHGAESEDEVNRVIQDETNRRIPGLAVPAAAQPSLQVPLPAGAQRAVTYSLLLSAVRCTIQYVLLPFVLPWIGIAAPIPPWITLLLSGLAIASLVRNVRLLMRQHHPRRWSYLGIAVVVATALLVFVAMDLRALLLT